MHVSTALELGGEGKPIRFNFKMLFTFQIKLTLDFDGIFTQRIEYGRDIPPGIVIVTIHPCPSSGAILVWDLF